MKEGIGPRIAGGNVVPGGDLDDVDSASGRKKGAWLPWIDLVDGESDRGANPSFAEKRRLRPSARTARRVLHVRPPESLTR